MTKDKLINKLNAARQIADNDSRCAKNNGFTIGNILISIQASEYTYCFPRETYKNMGNYYKIEAAFMLKNGKNKIEFGTWSLKYNDYKPLEVLQNYNSFGVFGYVPVNKLVRILTAIEEDQAMRVGACCTMMPILGA